MENGIRSGQRRGSDERGAAVVEFALAATLLLVLLFGIISYGYVLSFKQGMTQAAAEGARAGAVGSPADVDDAVERSVDAFDQKCNTGDGLTCEGHVPGVWPPDPYACGGSHMCVKVKLTYDYKNHPLLPPLPGLGLLLPDTLTSTRIAEVS